MTSLVRRRKASEPDHSGNTSSTEHHAQEEEKGKEKIEAKGKDKVKETGKEKKRNGSRWWCLDSCCWFIGWIVSIWWLLTVLYNALPQFVTDAITGPLPDPPGLKLKKEGLTVHHPVVFVPGIVTGGLELWEGRPCADGLFRKRLWGGTFGEVYKRPLCWVEHMSLDNETGMDPPGIRLRPVSGLVAADYFAPGYFVWAVLIANLAQIGYEEKTMHMAAYDWRISFQNTEVRDQALSRLKSNIELMVKTNNGRKVVAIPHSMGALYFLHFMKWVETPAPMGGGGGPDWCAKYIKAVMNIGGPFLGVPKAVTGLLSAEAKDVAVARGVTPGVVDNEFFGRHTLQHLMRMTRTWDATMSMLPKGGETIWGDLDWAPEEGYDCRPKDKQQEVRDERNLSTAAISSQRERGMHTGRIISFGKDAAELPSSELVMKDYMTSSKNNDLTKSNVSCGDVWTEYHEMAWESIEAVADHKVYTAETVLDLLHFVAPRLMQRGDTHFSYGIADNLDDPKYKHYKYWSNPLETKLPNAPDIEIYSMYGVGIPTERSYVYKLSPSADTCLIPFRIDTSADGGQAESCLKGGVYVTEGDETVPSLSAGFMCAKGWRGKTRFNPSGMSTYIREYLHAPPANILEGRGTQSGSHVDIMGNFALIEDIIRVAAGANGEDIGGDQVYSGILKWSEKIKLKL